MNNENNFIFSLTNYFLPPTAQNISAHVMSPSDVQCEHFIMPASANHLDFIPPTNVHLWDPSQVASTVQTVYPNNNNNNTKKQKTAAKTLAVLLQRRLEILNQLENIVSQKTSGQMKAVSFLINSPFFAIVSI